MCKMANISISILYEYPMWIVTAFQELGVWKVVSKAVFGYIKVAVVIDFLITTASICVYECACKVVGMYPSSDDSSFNEAELFYI